MGLTLNDTAGDGNEIHPVDVDVKVKVADPAETPVASPLLAIVATAALLLTQLPPEVGDKVVVAPTQREEAPVMEATGLEIMETSLVDEDEQPFKELVKVKLAVPPETPVTNPALLTVATVGLLEVQVPPVAGDNVVVLPSQMLLLPVMETEGLAFTVTALLGSEIQPAVVMVKTKVAVPALTPVTTPSFAMVATAGLLLTQVPPLDGDKVVVDPSQMEVGPEKAASGLG